jgi:RNA polymerase sigma-70 factor (ECF subfamily)
MLCRRYASNQEEVKDMFQSGLLEIFSDLHQFDASKANFSTWSNRILAHAALKRLKALKRLDSFERALLEEEDFEGIDIEDEKIDQETITQAIQKLPVGYRTVFNLYVLEGYTHAEIASSLDISVSTSKSQLLKAKKQLRRWLEVKL